MPDRDIGSIVEACTRGNGDISEIEAAVAAGANINAASNGATLPLMRAIREKRVDIVSTLLRLKADPNAPDSKGVSPLHAAIFDGKTDVVQNIIDSNADVDRRDRHGQTPLFFAPSRKVCGQLELAKCDVNVLNEKGQSALHLAAHAGLNDTVLWLLERMTKDTINAQDRHGRTAVYCAAHSNLKSTILLLQENGADVRLRPFKYPQKKAKRALEDAHRKNVIEDTSNSILSGQKARDRFGSNLSIDTTSETKSKDKFEIISPKRPLNELRHLQDERNEADPEVLDELAKQLEERDALMPDVAVDDFNLSTSEEKGWISRPPLTAVGPFSFPIRPFGDYYIANVPSVEGFLQVLCKRHFPDARSRASEPPLASEARQAQAEAAAEEERISKAVQTPEEERLAAEAAAAKAQAEAAIAEERRLRAVQKAEEEKLAAEAAIAKAQAEAIAAEERRLRAVQKAEEERLSAEAAAVKAQAEAAAEERRLRAEQEAAETRLAAEAQAEAAAEEDRRLRAVQRSEQERLTAEALVVGASVSAVESRSQVSALTEAEQKQALVVGASVSADDSLGEEEQKQVAELTQKFGGREDVANFALRGIQGVWCTYHRERTNEWIPALYSFDAGAKYFILLTGESLDFQELVCPLGCIREVCSLETEVKPSDTFLAHSKPPDRDRLVMVTFENENTRTRFCLLEESPLERTNFVSNIRQMAAIAMQMESQTSCEAAKPEAELTEELAKEEMAIAMQSEAKDKPAREAELELEVQQLKADLAEAKRRAEAAMALAMQVEAKLNLKAQDEAAVRKAEEERLASEAAAAKAQADAAAVAERRLRLREQAQVEAAAAEERRLRALQKAEEERLAAKAAAVIAVQQAEEERLAAEAAAAKAQAEAAAEEERQLRAAQKAEEERLAAEAAAAKAQAEAAAAEEKRLRLVQKVDVGRLAAEAAAAEALALKAEEDARAQDLLYEQAMPQNQREVRLELEIAQLQARLIAETRRAEYGMLLAKLEEAKLKAEDEANAAREVRLATEEKALALKAEEEARAQELAAEQARQRALEEERQKAEADARLQAILMAEEEARLAEEAKRKAEEEARAQTDEARLREEADRKIEEANVAAALVEADINEERRRAAEAKALAMQEDAKLTAQDEVNAAREMRMAIEEKALALKAEEEARAQDLLAEQTSPVKSEVMQKIMVKEDVAQKDQEDAVIKIQRIQRGRSDRLRVEKKRNAIPVGSTDFEGASVWEVPLRKVKEKQKYGFSHTNAKVELLREYTKAFLHGAARLDESNIELDQTLLSDEEYPEALIVKKISDRGLMGEWNFIHPEAEVKPGDRLIEVNGAKTITEMQKQLRTSECICKVLRSPEVFHIILDKTPERRFGFKFEKPAVKSLRELKITEITKDGLLDEANRHNMRRGCHHQVVLPGMRIEATDEVEGDCFQIAEALRRCNKPILLRVRRAGFFQLGLEKVGKKAKVISAMQLGTGQKMDVPLQSTSVYSLDSMDPVSPSTSA